MISEAEKSRLIKSFREHFAALGFPLDHLTDDQIVQGVMRAGAALAATGLTLEEAGRRMAVATRDIHWD